MRRLSDVFGAIKGSPPNLAADSMAALGEFIGTAVFIFLALSGVQGGLEAPTGIPRDEGPTPDQIQSIAFSFGASVTVGMMVCGAISGGVLNTAILLSLVVTGNVNWLRGILFFFAELAGAILGAYFANFVTAHELQGVNLLNPGFNYAQGFFAELLLSCCLCLTVLFIIVDKTVLADYAPFVVGVALFMCHMIGAPIDGTSVNPARSFAASIVTGKWANHWIFWFGPLIGGFFAACIFLGCKMLEDKSQSQILLHQADQMNRTEGKEVHPKHGNTYNVHDHPGNGGVAINPSTTDPRNNIYHNPHENNMYDSTSNNNPALNPTTQNTHFINKQVPNSNTTGNNYNYPSTDGNDQALNSNTTGNNYNFPTTDNV